MGIQPLRFLRKRRLGRERQQKKERVGGKKETANDVLKCNSTFMKYSLPQTRLILKIKCPGICPSDLEALIYDLSKAANLMIHNRSGRNIAAPKGRSWERDGSAWPCSALPCLGAGAVSAQENTGPNGSISDFKKRKVIFSLGA